jgi:hypothetical protein
LSAAVVPAGGLFASFHAMLLI